MTIPILAADQVGFAYRQSAPVLTDVSFDVLPGRSTALVGESGAGKTTLLRLLLGLARPSAGEIRFDGAALDLRDRRQMHGFRRGVQTVFQDPYSSLDPRQRVNRIVAEPLRSLGLISGSRQEQQESIRVRVADALDSVDMPVDAASRYPHEFSGGQRQRIAIARAIVCDPRVLLADEPVSALDVTTRVRIVDLLAELRESRGLTVVMVSARSRCGRDTVPAHGGVGTWADCRAGRYGVGARGSESLVHAAADRERATAAGARDFRPAVGSAIPRHPADHRCHCIAVISGFIRTAWRA